MWLFQQEWVRPTLSWQTIISFLNFAFCFRLMQSNTEKLQAVFIWPIDYNLGGEKQYILIPHMNTWQRTSWGKWCTSYTPPCLYCSKERISVIINITKYIINKQARKLNKIWLWILPQEVKFRESIQRLNNFSSVLSCWEKLTLNLSKC